MNTNFIMNNACKAIVANRMIATRSTTPNDFVTVEAAEAYLSAVDDVCRAVHGVLTSYSEDAMQELDNAIHAVARCYGLDSVAVNTSALKYRAITAMSSMATRKSDKLKAAEKTAREARKEYEEAMEEGIIGEKLEALKKEAGDANNHVAALKSKAGNMWYEPRVLFRPNFTNASEKARKNLEDLIADVITERTYKSATTLAMEYAAEQARKKAAREAKKAAEKAAKKATKTVTRPTEETATSNK